MSFILLKLLSISCVYIIEYAFAIVSIKESYYYYYYYYYYFCSASLTHCTYTVKYDVD